MSETLRASALEFLAPVPGQAPARSPLAGAAHRDGARVELRDGWELPVAFGDPASEARAIAEAVGVADASFLEKHESPGVATPGTTPLVPGMALRHGETWWCPLNPTRVLVVGGPSPGAGWLDLTAAFAGLRLLGSAARDTLARLSALDLRPTHAPVGALRPGSVARTPAIVVRERADGYLLLFGAAYAEYMWTAVVDAARGVGGAPVGVDAAKSSRSPEQDDA
jgi:glycine cleavage system aminomethyltransferase T